MKKYSKTICSVLLMVFISLIVLPAYANENSSDEEIFLSEIGHGEYSLSTTRSANGIMVKKYHDSIYKIVENDTKMVLPQDYFIKVDDTTFLMAEEIIINPQNKNEVKKVIHDNNLDEATSEILLDENTKNTVYLYSTSTPDFSAYASKNGYYYRINDVYFHGTTSYKEVVKGYNLKDKFSEIVTNVINIGVGEVMMTVTKGGWIIADIVGYSVVPDPVDITYDDYWQVKLDEDKQRRTCFMSRVEGNPDYYPMKAAAERASVTYFHDIYFKKLITTVQKQTYETIYTDHYNTLADYAIQHFNDESPALELIKSYKVENTKFTISY